jgi:hypothetical protein
MTIPIETVNLPFGRLLMVALASPSSSISSNQAAGMQLIGRSRKVTVCLIVLVFIESIVT